MKHHNPHTPIMIREALNTQPRVFARYEFGREKMADLAGKETRRTSSRGGGQISLSRTCGRAMGHEVAASEQRVVVACGKKDTG